MTRRRILFLHGWFSHGRRKSSVLRSLGYDVKTPSLSNWSFQSAIDTALEAFNEFRPDAVVGASRGAAVAMSLDDGEVPIVLIAPAWRFFGIDPKVRSPRAIIIHSPNDVFVPFFDSETLVRINPGVRLIAAGEDHRLNCIGGQAALNEALSELLDPPLRKSP